MQISQYLPSKVDFMLPILTSLEMCNRGPVVLHGICRYTFLLNSAGDLSDSRVDCVVPTRRSHSATALPRLLSLQALGTVNVIIECIRLLLYEAQTDKPETALFRLNVPNGSQTYTMTSKGIRRGPVTPLIIHGPDVTPFPPSRGSVFCAQPKSCQCHRPCR